MRFVRLTTMYPDYLRAFYGTQPELYRAPFLQQRAKLREDAFALTGAWPGALASAGFEADEIVLNAEPLQRAWARENMTSGNPTLAEIALEQLRRFQPDVLWYTHFDASFLKTVREKIPSIRFAFGWVGSALPRTDVWKHLDLVLSCAPETVETLRQQGMRAEHLPHGFDLAVADRLAPARRTGDVAFIGQILKSKQFHLFRQDLLDTLADQLDLTIYSPNHVSALSPRVILRDALFLTSNALESMGMPQSMLSRMPAVGRAANWAVRPWNRLSSKVQRRLRPAVFGREMFQTIVNSHVVLNIHADSSPRFASNMRLFETTGVGGCLVTDWKSNLSELFVPDKEVVTYRSAEECVEKVRWLIANPAKRDEIARAGRARTFRDHKLSDRANRLTEILRSQTLFN